MAKGKTVVIKAVEGYIELEVEIGNDYRVTIPSQIRNLVNPKQKKRLIIKNVPET